MTEKSPESADLIDLEPFSSRLRSLDWSRGLTRDRIRRLVPEFPFGVYLLLPSERLFRSFDELVAFYQHSWRRARQQGIAASGAAEDGGPAAWGPSSPSIGARAVGGRHGIGSGADTGFTGSDDVGTDRSGATYGPGSDESEGEAE